MADLDLNKQPLYITFPDLVFFELKSGLIHLLPNLHGLPGEKPRKYHQELQIVCLSMKPPSVTEEHIKMWAFPFLLKGVAKDWLYYLPIGSIATWNEMKKKFLEKYFPVCQATNLRKEICGIK